MSINELYFLARHTPFWGVPIVVLASEFAYMFWLKKKKRTALFCVSLAMIAGACCAFYFYQGGPEKTVKYIKKIHRDHK